MAFITMNSNLVKGKFLFHSATNHFLKTQIEMHNSQHLVFRNFGSLLSKNGESFYLHSNLTMCRINDLIESRNSKLEFLRYSSNANKDSASIVEFQESPESNNEIKGNEKLLIIYSKSGCCLCDSLKEKIDTLYLQAEEDFMKDVKIEIRDITSNKEWESKYQYEIPVMTTTKDGKEFIIPRQPPRVSIDRLKKHLASYLS